MGRKNFNTFLKKQRAEKKRKKKEQKKEKMEARKNESTSSNLDDMIAYVDEEGNITSDPPEEDAPDKDTPEGGA